MDKEEIQDTTDISTLDDSNLDEALALAEGGQQSEGEEKSAEAKKSEVEGETKNTEADTSNSNVGGEEGTSNEKNTTSEPTELEKLQERFKEQDKFLKRQANEIGEFRKKERERLEAQESRLDPLKEEYGEDLANDVAAAVKDDIKREAEIATLDKYNAEQRSEYNKSVVLNEIPDVMEMIDDIANLAEKDGFEPEHINYFKANPFMNSDTNVILSYARIVKANRDSAALKTELEQLKQKQEGTLKKIEEASSSTSGLTGKIASSGNNASISISEAQIPNLSYAELEKALQTI